MKSTSYKNLTRNVEVTCFSTGSSYVKLALLLAGDGADGTTMELAKVGALLRSSWSSLFFLFQYSGCFFHYFVFCNIFHDVSILDVSMLRCFDMFWWIVEFEVRLLFQLFHIFDCFHGECCMGDFMIAPWHCVQGLFQPAAQGRGSCKKT